MTLATASVPTMKQREAAHEALAALPADQATALLLASRPGLTYRDVAAHLDVEPAVVLRWITDGMRSLRRPGTWCP